jgi:hypothetical protein
MMAEPTVFLSVRDPQSDLEAVFEDDGRVAYAYVVKDRRILADVWVYNRAPAPAQPEWKDRERAPFLNPRDYVTDDADRFEPAASEKDLALEWVSEGTDRIVVLKVRGKVAAKLGPGMRPGFATLARRDGPLARVLHRE